ncbi:MAG: phosphatase PAP2 family protein [Chloroflexota bacterium]
MATRTVAGQASDEQQQGSSRLRSWRFLILVLVATVAAGVMAMLARAASPFPLDVSLTRELQAIQLPGLGAFFHAIAWVGFPPQSNIIWGAVILGLFLIGMRLESVMLLFAAAGSAAIWFWIVPLIGRPRPTPDLVHVAVQLPTGSFPSGHVLNLTAIFGFLIFLVLISVGNAVLRRTLVALLAVVPLTIGLSRVYDGAHWPSDVLGGYLIGGVWLALTIELYLQAKARLADWRLRHAAHHDNPQQANASQPASPDLAGTA